MRALGLCGIGLALALMAPCALADSSAVSDQVQTVDGGTYRGTLVENVPNGDVVLLLPTGETKRFARATVRYAGPFSAAAATPDQETTRPTNGFTVHGSTVDVQFEATMPSTLYAEDAWAVARGAAASATGYARICTSPCTLTMPMGTHHFALSRENDDAPRVVDDEITVSQPSKLHAEWHPHGGLRLGGILLLSIGVPIGLATGVVGFALGYLDSTCNTPVCYGTPRTLTWVGYGVALASLVGGLILVTRHDHVTIEVTPLALPPAPGAAGTTGPTADRRGTRFDATGLGARVVF